MDRSFLRPFLVYAYSFVLLILLNGIVMRALLNFGVSPFFVKLLPYFVSPLFLFFSFKFSFEKFGGFKEEKKLFKAWILHFVPFVVLSFLVSFMVKNPFSFFIFLNLELLFLFVTCKFTYDKVIKG